MPVSEETFLQVIAESDQWGWELICGRMQMRPAMSRRHASAAIGLTVQLRAQLSIQEFDLHLDSVYLRAGVEHHFIPAVAVIPLACSEQSGGFVRVKCQDGAVPLVAELWSEEVEGHDLDTKVWQYQGRGDTEVWLLHPFNRTLTAWRKQPDGIYTETLHTTGNIQPVALPNVTITLDTLFD